MADANKRTTDLECIASDAGLFESLTPGEIDDLIECLTFNDQEVDSFNAGFVTVNCPHCKEINDASGDLRGVTVECCECHDDFTISKIATIHFDS